ncbi:hypothetical protein [Moritella sp. Urea-trap-13]|uniref:hypothetical protein n=1 Tax=Moritella sp. Urea-trap-13 TaxID=2058327 RepID=UPI000C322C12|nr:hypothetical protein [Moritella sp. Urea-trap-13]PKH08177.1 hypothetical protein CXF93_05740 [Moritella sp. Urea-trap-13]
MDKIREESFVSEIERRLIVSSFGENNKNCVVVRLNDDLTEKNSIQESTFKLRAHGFKASITNAKKSSFVILTNTKGISLIGSIIDVERHDSLEGRINIYFRDPCHIDTNELSKHITWNNSNPVRTISL